MSAFFGNNSYHGWIEEVVNENNFRMTRRIRRPARKLSIDDRFELLEYKISNPEKESEKPGQDCETITGAGTLKYKIIKLEYVQVFDEKKKTWIWDTMKTLVDLQTGDIHFSLLHY